MAVLDRSWYGRVLVERVEGFASEEQWRRAYDEIDEVERMWVAEGMILVKLFLHISDAEQLDRFRKREKDPLKSWKLTEDDWRNRKRRPDYEAAVEEMLERTGTPHAPWTLVEARALAFARRARRWGPCSRSMRLSCPRGAKRRASRAIHQPMPMNATSSPPAMT
jgi:polyphosphate kinase 2 (PPK2 family)